MAGPDFSAQEWILLISFVLIYLVFLGYDLFKRSGEKYGALAYVIAIIPANYLWYITAVNNWDEFGYTGAMTVLTVLWILGIIRDIFVKDKERKIKDADDVALIIIIAVILNIIVSGVLPRFEGTSILVEGGAATQYASVFYMPNITATAQETALIILIYKIAVTLLVVILLIPIIIDLRGTKTNLVAIIVISAIFVAPFYYIALLWMAAENIGVMLLLISIVFFITLLLITRSRD